MVLRIELELLTEERGGRGELLQVLEDPEPEPLRDLAAAKRRHLRPYA